MKSKTWLILGIGFGTLVVLIGILGGGSWRRSEQINRETEAVHSADRRSEQLLNGVRSGIYLSAIFVRDFLLDPSHLTATMYREELLELRSGMRHELDELDAMLSPAEKEPLNALRTELQAYWDIHEPLFTWTPQQKLALSSIFLRRQVLPRRNAILAMAEEVGQLRTEHFRKRQQALERARQDFRTYQSRMLTVALLLGAMVAIASILRITRLEQQMENQQHRAERAEQEMRRLSSKLVRAQEDERKSIARELHDEVGQMLTVLRIELGNMERVRGDSGGVFQERATDAKLLAEKTLQTVRDLAMGLRPSMLDDLGLGPALEWQARDFGRRCGVPVDLQIEGAVEGLPETHRTCVYRVIQEALTNCARHSKAKSVRISIHGSGRELSLTVQDDGVGFLSEKRLNWGMGLIGIEERVRELGGKFEVISQPKKGAVLRVGMPLTGTVRAGAVV